MKSIENSHLQITKISYPNLQSSGKWVLRFFFENSICLMLFPSPRNLSCESEYSSNFRNFSIRSYQKTRMIYKHVSIPISWIHRTEKNLIKIWKWLHGTQDHPPNYVNCRKQRTKHTQQYDNYLISNAIMLGETGATQESWKVMHEQWGDYAEMFEWNSCTVWHKTFLLFGGEYFEWFLCVWGRKDWNNEKLHSLFFCSFTFPHWKLP